MSDILIVDDERDIRELISEILIDEGYTTRLAGTSEDAMREVTSQPPGLMILDIWLKDSDMDGIDILKKVKSDYPEVPVVIISGHGNIEIAVAAIKQGAYDFIENPLILISCWWLFAALWKHPVCAVKISPFVKKMPLSAI